MCRLFGLSGGPNRIKATFWLLESPDNLARQSRKEHDGTGLGVFDTEGRPHVMREPIAAYEDTSSSHETREKESRAFVGHIRYASTGGMHILNTHPFEQHGRLFAHNGVIQDLETGELLRVNPDLSCTTTKAIDFSPSKPLTLADLEGRAPYGRLRVSLERRYRWVLSCTRPIVV